MAACRAPHLIFAEAQLPDIGASELIRSLRERFTIPIIIVTEGEAEELIVSSLEAGADDYIKKPFGVPELVARANVALRRSHRVHANTSSPFLECGSLKIDLARRRTSVAGVPLHLTPTEYRLLTILARSVGKVVAHDLLLGEAGGSQHQDAHNVRIYVGYLRTKLSGAAGKEIQILNEPRIGYRLVVAS